MLQSPLTPFHPVIAGWFSANFGEPTDVQAQAWAAIAGARSHTLIAAPTGSGKTLAALLPCLDDAVRSKLQGIGTGTSKGIGTGSGTGTSTSIGTGTDTGTGTTTGTTTGTEQPTAVPASLRRTRQGTRIIYITPLKALNNDIHHHAVQFIEQLQAYAAATDAAWPGLTAAVRSGDTPASARAAMLRKPPDLLLTTPESLYILLTSDKGRDMLRTATHIIVDEIHSLASDKRGSHLSLSLERLAALCAAPLLRIGVSATQKPLERVAAFLGGWEPPSETQPLAGEPPGALALADMERPHPLGYRPREVTIIESHMDKRFQLSITMPDFSRPVTTRDSAWFPLLERIIQLMGENRSTLIFANSRRLCERLCLRLNDFAGYELARAHHGSMAKAARLEVEQLLKEGKLRALIATSSLELGIDVGAVELVIQIDSPQDAATGIQRIGRAGHGVGDTSHGVLLARQGGILPELAVLSRLISERDIEPIRILRNPLGVLAQQVVAMAATEDWSLAGLHRLVCSSDSFRDFPESRLVELLQVLGGYYPVSRPLLQWLPDEQAIRRRANTTMAAISGAGTIPQSSAYPVHHVESRVQLGELDEEFVHESRTGDVFQLGTSSWMIQSIQRDRVYVSEAPNRFSEIPFWRAESRGRSYELGVLLGQFHSALAARLASAPETMEGWLAGHYGMDAASAEQLASLAESQLKSCGMPTDAKIVVEYYKDLADQTHIIVHNVWGRRFNRTWLLAIERMMASQRSGDRRLYGNAKDNGIEFVTPDWDSSWLQALWQVTADNVDELLLEGIPGSPLFGAAFRHIAETSLLLSRSFTRMPLWQKRLRSEQLLKEALPYAERFPFLQEAARECLEQFLDAEHLKLVLRAIAAGDIAIHTYETAQPSPLAAQFLADYASMQIYEGDGLDEQLQLQLMQVNKTMAKQLFGQAEAIPQPVLAAEQERLAELERPPADRLGLLAILKQRGDMSPAELAQLVDNAALPEWLGQLQAEGRVRQLVVGEAVRWICAEEREEYAAFPATPSSVALIAGRFADYRLSFTAQELAARYPQLSPDAADGIIAELLRQDRIAVAPFAAEPDEQLFTSKKVASRLIRFSLQHNRALARPASAARWCGQAALLQHAWSGTQGAGEEGLRSAIARLQGLFLPLSHWESILLPARVAKYRKEELDLLCASGEVIWLGSKADGEKEGRIAFFLTESYPLYAPLLLRQQQVQQEPPEQQQLAPTTPQGTAHPELLLRLRDGGACFLAQLSRDTGRLPSELLPELLELAWEGHVSNDQFAPLRLQAQAKGQGKGRGAYSPKQGSGLGRWYWTGSLLAHASAASSGPGPGGQPATPLKGQPAPFTGQSPAGASADPAVPDHAAAWVHHLIGSFGIINKKLVQAVAPYSWEALLPMLARFEELGSLRRGMFIQGAISLQFTTPEMATAVKQPLPASSSPAAVTVLSAADPANPFGLLLDWPDEATVPFARKPGNFLVLRDSEWLLYMESNGRKLFARSPLSAEEACILLPPILKQVLARQHATKVRMEYWNGEPIEQSELGPLLRAAGAERDRNGLVLWASQL